MQAEPKPTLDGADGDDELYIRCEDLFKIYKTSNLEVVALRGLDLKVRRGEFMAIVGASGSGKSTLLNILAGLDTPSAGRCFVGGQDLLTMSTKEMVRYRRRQVGFVWQQTGRNLVPYLTALQNVEVPMVLDGVAPGEARARAQRLLELVLLGHRLHHRPEMLSGGEQQRVSIAVALANEPPLLLADEPTGEVDNQSAEQIFHTLRALNADFNVTIIIVTHNMQQAQRVSDFTAFYSIRKQETVPGVENRWGVLVEYAPTQQLFEKPAS
ncbi:MAG: ABC transporter ATP-binding protein, partial [Tepidiforma sp.]